MYSIEQLKAMAYDLIRQKELTEQNLRQVNSEIQKLEKQQAEAAQQKAPSEPEPEVIKD